MSYIIIYDGKAWYTDWYDYENNYKPGMIIIDIHRDRFSVDGTTWKKIEYDHL